MHIRWRGLELPSQVTCDAESLTHTYGKFIKPAELRGWTVDSGLAFKDLTGLHYNPILRKYSAGGNTHVNYLMHFRKAPPSSSPGVNSRA